MQKSIISKINKAELIGRGGGCFPVWKKWAAVAKAITNKDNKDKKVYVICNASEGEPGVKKDLYILERYANRVVDGMKLAIEYLDKARGKTVNKNFQTKSYIYLNLKYYQNKKLRKKLKSAIGGLPIDIFKKPRGAGYIGGEETSVINGIEGARIEPRLRPPFPPTKGLFGRPTLINNVETFYNVSLALADEYKKERFYTINGDCLWTRVYEFPEEWTIEKILKKTGNYPDFDFFVQVGGDASGEVLNSKQLKRPTGGCGAITIYSVIKYDSLNLIRKWLKFFLRESCGQCAPCREGSYRLREILNDKKSNWQIFSELLNNLRDTSFCGLGCAAPIAVTTFIKNVLSKDPGNKIKIPKADKKMLCECFFTHNS